MIVTDTRPANNNFIVNNKNCSTIHTTSLQSVATHFCFSLFLEQHYINYLIISQYKCSNSCLFLKTFQYPKFICAHSFNYILLFKDVINLFTAKNKLFLGKKIDLPKLESIDKSMVQMGKFELLHIAILSLFLYSIRADSEQIKADFISINNFE